MRPRLWLSPSGKARVNTRDSGHLPRQTGEGWGGGKQAIGALLLLLISLPALAVEPSEMLPDPALEARARTLSRELRCVVCQNQSVDDSQAEVAHDIRRAVRERLSSGDSDSQVLDYMTRRYGDYVLMNPPLKARTLALWLGAPLVLLVGCIGLFLAARRRPAVVAPVPLSEEERKKLDALLSDKNAVIPSAARDP